jgi:hypothetical protein
VGKHDPQLVVQLVEQPAHLGRGPRLSRETLADVETWVHA